MGQHLVAYAAGVAADSSWVRGIFEWRFQVVKTNLDGALALD
jgi:hypothetical protein